MSEEPDLPPAPSENPLEGASFPSLEEMAALLPQYEFHDILGIGGMGGVYLARQAALDRWVAIKLLPATASQNEEDAQRFIIEARSMARLTHAHIAAVHDFGQTAQGQFYLVMEHVNGMSLHQLIHGEDVLDKNSIRSVVTQLCDALDYAHGHGIIHRDIKPANILITGDWQAKIIDFGLANDTNAEAAGEAQYGTPDYVAPERLHPGAKVDHRADIYSLGVVIHEMFAKLTPQAAGTTAGPGIPPEFATVVARCTTQDPGLRFQKCSEIKAFLSAASIAPAPTPAATPAASPAPSLPPHLRPPQPRKLPPSSKTYQESKGVPGWVWAAACVVVLGVAGWFIQSQRSKEVVAENAAAATPPPPAETKTDPDPAPAAPATAPVAAGDVPPGPFKPGSGTFSVLKRLKGHTEMVYASAILADQRHAVSGGHDDTLRLWDVATGAELKSFPSPVGDIHGIQAAADGRRVLLWSYRTDQAAIFDVENGKTIATIKAPNDRLTQAAWTSDQQGAYLLCNATDGGVYHWDPAKGAELQQFADWPRAAYQIFPLPAVGAGSTPRVLVLGCTMKPNPDPNATQQLVTDQPWAALFSVPDHRHIRDLPDYTNIRNQLSLSPDATTLAGGISAMHLLNVPTLRPRSTVNVPPGTHCSGSAWAAGGRLMAAGYSDGNLVLIDPEAGDQLAVLHLGLRPNAISVSQDESWMLVSGFPKNVQAPQPEDFEVVVVRLPDLERLGSEKSFLSMARRQLPRLASVDPELFTLRTRASAADDTGYGAKLRDLTGKYGTALQRAASTAAPKDRAAMQAEADAIAKGAGVPDISTDAATTGDHQRLRGIYRQQIAQLDPLRRESNTKVRASLEPAVNILNQKRRQEGDQLGAARCAAVLLSLSTGAAPAPTLAARPSSPSPAPGAPAAPLAARPPTPVMPTAPSLQVAKPAFGSEVKIEVVIGRPSKIKGGDFDDKMQVIEPRIKMTNTSLQQGYEGYKACFLLIGESTVDTKIIKVMQRQEFPVALPARLFLEKELPSITTQYDTTGAKFGCKYDGWLVQIIGPGGEIVHTKSTSPSLEKLPEQVMQLKEGMFYDRKLKGVGDPDRRF